MFRMSAALLLATAFAACGRTDPTVPEDGFMRAYINGAVELRYFGPSSFHGNEDLTDLSIDSHEQESAGVIARSIRFRGLGGVLLPDSTLVRFPELRPGGPPVHGFRVIVDDLGDFYVAREGILVADQVSVTGLKGSFSFRAFRYCSVGAVSCELPEEVPTDSPWIDVRGEFFAVPSPPPTPL